MCGIVGFFGFKNSDLLNQMTDLVSHRGPDQDIKYENKKINIGFRRLSINDLSKGNQPFYDARKKIGVFCNGEIYNHKLLRQDLEKKNYIFKTNSDCEVILHGYIEYGLDFLKKINGMFFLIIWKDEEQKIILARDRMGEKPCYYTRKNNNIFFSSEIKPLLKNNNIQKTLNFNSIDFFLNNRYVPSSNNLIKEIATLEPGTLLEISEKTFKKIKYWDFDNYKILTGENDSKFYNLFETSVNLRMTADVKVGVFLSGGLDSSILTSLMSKKKKNFEIFTHSYDEKNDESIYAKKLCKELNLKNFNLIKINEKHIHNLENIVETMESPIGNSDIIGLDLLCNAAKIKNTKVILSGEGSDEIFAGYLHHQKLKKLYKIKNILNVFNLNNIFSKCIKVTPKSLFNLFFNYGNYKVTNDLIDNLENYFNEKSEINSYFNLISLVNKKDKNKLYTSNFSNELNKANIRPYLNEKLPNFLDKILRFELENWLPSYHLIKEDKISMGHSIEMRFPFLDHNIYEHMKMSNNKNYLANNKQFLKNEFSNILPSYIKKRKKGPILVPIVDTFKTEFIKMYRDILTEKAIRKYNFFNYSFLETLFIQFEESKNYMIANKIFSLLVLQIWLNKFYK
jgi:asparagine synthase (glutamine-hydrolysing)